MKPETKKRMNKLLTEVFLLSGAGLVTFGAWLAWPPAGPLVGGGLLITAGVMRDRAGA